MDFITTTNTSLSRAVPRKQQASRSRKVYLDTYAKQREVAKVKPAAAQPDRQKVMLASIPMAVVSPAVLASPKRYPTEKMMRALSRRAIALSKSPQNVLVQNNLPAVVAVTNQFPQPQQQHDARMEANLQALYQPSLTEQLQKASTNSANHIRTIMATALACGVISLSIFAFVTRADTQAVVAQPVGSPVIELEGPAQQAQPKGKQAPLVSDFVARKPTDPVKIIISSIGVDAQIEGLGTNADGQIAVPKAYGLVGWYNKGNTVSEPGPTVLVGHYAGGGGAVFDKLGNTKNGDLITVTTAQGKSYTYKITKKVEYPKDKVPMKQIFKGGTESRLEIITCQGVWSGTNYNNRLVVTAELVR